MPAKVDPGKGIQELRSFLNVSDEDFVLCVAWLLAAIESARPVSSSRPRWGAGQRQDHGREYA